jgi:F-type H+-transporting ATPase subunit a
MKYFKQLLALVLVAMALAPARAAANAGAEEGPLDVTELIMEHISDSYDWHVTDIGDKSIVLHLPVIVKSSTGWHVFSSEGFSEAPDAKGYRMGPDQLAIATKGDNAGKIVELQGGQEVLPFDISITKTVAVLFINAVLLLLAILIPARWYRRHKAEDPAPKGFTGMVEMLVMYVEDNVVKPGIGEGYQKYSPYLLTCFFFIFISNLMGVIPFPPGGGNLTGNIAVTFLLALLTFLITQFSGTSHYWKEIFWPEVPMALKAPLPLIPLIEFVGIFTKPFALMIRLFANMMAGHAIALALTSIIFLVAAEGIGVTFYGMTALSVVMSIFMMCLELLVCFIQAFVFTMLSAIFIGLAKAKPEGHAE